MMTGLISVSAIPVVNADINHKIIILLIGSLNMLMRKKMLRTVFIVSVAL
jgi:hypothetical protein